MRTPKLKDTGYKMYDDLPKGIHEMRKIRNREVKKC